LFFIAILCEGCKKKETSRVPVLAPPEKASSSVGQPGDQENVPAEAEVKASSGPVELTLRIYKTKIRAHKSLYYQIVLKNIGAKAFPAVDAAFRDPWAQRHPEGVYLDVLGPNGKEPGWAWLGPTDVDTTNLPGFLPPPTTKEGASFWQKLKGMSAFERSKAVMDYSARIKAEYEKTHPEPPVGGLLAPGASTSTPAWVLPNDEGKPLRQPIGHFTELVHFDFSLPGKYRMRAVYDYRPDGWTIKWNRDHHRQPDEAQNVVKTPFIEFEVLP